MQLPAGISKATLAATCPRQCFKPSASLSTTTLAATGPNHLLLEGSRLPFARPQTPQTLPQAFPRQLLQLPARISNATLAATCPRQCFKPFCKPFHSNSRSYRPQPSVFRAFKTAACLPSNPSNPSNPPAGLQPFQGNSRSYRPQPSVFKGVQDCHLPVLKPLKPSRRPFQGNSCSFPQAFPTQLSQLHAPDKGISKATLAATCPRQCFKPFRKPFHSNSRSYRPQTSVFRAFKSTVCPSNPPASLSKATLAATCPRQCFKPSASLSTTTLAATGPNHLLLERSRLPFARTQTPSNPPAGLSKATLAASRRHFQGNSCSYMPQTMLQTLPQAFPQQLSQLQLQAPAICF